MLDWLILIAHLIAYCPNIQTTHEGTAQKLDEPQ